MAMAIQRGGFRWLRQLKELGLSGYIDFKSGFKWIW
jgi:hypothetical protein